VSPKCNRRSARTVQSNDSGPESRKKDSRQPARHFFLCPRVGPTSVKKLPFSVDDGYWTIRVQAHFGEVLKGCHRQVL